MDSDIKKLIEKTTIILVYDEKKYQKIYGSECYVSRYHREQEKRFKLEDFENLWNDKWNLFKKRNIIERQNFYHFYNSFKLFYLSFEQLKYNKIVCINISMTEKEKFLYLNQVNGVNLYGIYYHGKRCIDLLKKLKLFNKNFKNNKFLNKFRETRNKIFEHNFDPKGFKFHIYPSIWSLLSTGSLLTIHINKTNNEGSYLAYIDYYEDYYNLEEKIIEIIKNI